jgi:excisionase family DNA binding protein
VPKDISFLFKAKKNMENEKLIEAIRAIVREEIRAAMGVGTGEGYMTAQEASEYTKYSVETLYTYACKGAIESLNKGNKLLFRKSDLDAWLNKKKPSVIHIASKRGVTVRNPSLRRSDRL